MERFMFVTLLMPYQLVVPAVVTDSPRLPTAGPG